MKKIRIDQLVFDLGHAPSREKAKALIMSGIVFVDGARVDKAGTMISPESQIEVRGSTLKYVSRGGLKLEKALASFGFDPSGLTCIDCGASTGGFTDVLLQNGAAKVYAVDVGYGQLAWSLRTNGRVINLERTNVRYITKEQVPETIDLAVMDLAFISIKLVIPAVSLLLRDDGDMICLIKPQFEAGRYKVGKKGVVRDEETHAEVISDILDFARQNGFSVMGLDYSPIRGPEGNIEYLVHLRKGEYETKEFSAVSVAAESHASDAFFRKETTDGPQ